MSLLIPKVFIDDISQRSGFIAKGTKFGDKTLKGLFMTPENVKYLGQELYSLIVNPKYVAFVLSRPENAGTYHEQSDWAYAQSRMRDNITTQAARLVKIFNGRQKFISELIPDLINSNPKDFWINDFFTEDYGINNPVQQLHHLNKKFLETNASGIILQPDMIDEHYFHRNPDLGNLGLDAAPEYTEYAYGAASYSDGTWHPEHLFTENARNRSTSYWVPREISFDTNPPHAQKNSTRGFRPFDQNRVMKKEGYASLDSQEPRDIQREHFEERTAFPDIAKLSLDPYLDDYTYGPGPGPGNKYMYDSYGDNGFSDRGTFPRWQYSVNDRPYERNIDDGLRDGGISDRRVNSPRRSGYDMSALISKSTY